MEKIYKNRSELKHLGGQESPGRGSRCAKARGHKGSQQVKILPGGWHGRVKMTGAEAEAAGAAAIKALRETGTNPLGDFV